MATEKFVNNFINNQQQLKNMFNTFIAERSLQDRKKHQQEERKLSHWFRKYKTEVRPHLVQRYERRINGFAKKMDDDPVILNEEEQPTLAKLFRVSDNKMNISDKSFKFRDAEDWRSLLSPLQRAQRQQILKSSRKNGEDPHLAFRSIESQSQYQTRRVEYRSRDRCKQINPPMKYTNKNSKAVFDSLPIIQSKRDKAKKTRQRKHTQHNILGTNTNISRQSISSQARQSDNNFSQADLVSLYNSSLLRKKQHNKTQLQIIQEEELKALAHEKLYFKSLVQLQQNVKTRKEKDDVKGVLKKCKIIRSIKTEVERKEEFDNFIQMMKSK